MNTSRTGHVRPTLLALTAQILSPFLTEGVPAIAWEGSAHTIVSQPNSPVGLSIDLTGFTIERDQLKPNGRRYLMASHPGTGMNVAIVMEQVAGQASTGGCITHLRQLKQGPTVSRGIDVAFSTTRDIPTLEYTLPRFQDVRLDQKSVRLHGRSECLCQHAHVESAVYRCRCGTLSAAADHRALTAGTIAPDHGSPAEQWPAVVFG